MGEEKTVGGYWSSMPGVLTAIAGLITAVAALVGALVAAGIIGPKFHIGNKLAAHHRLSCVREATTSVSRAGDVSTFE